MNIKNKSTVMILLIFLASCQLTENVSNTLKKPESYDFNPNMKVYQYGSFTRESERLFFKELCSFGHSGASLIGLSWYDCKVTDCFINDSHSNQPVLSIYEYESTILDEPVFNGSIAINNKNHIASVFYIGLDKNFDIQISQKHGDKFLPNARVTLKPNNTALFYDFSSVDQNEAVSPQYVLKCNVKAHKYISKSEARKRLKEKNGR